MSKKSTDDIVLRQVLSHQFSGLASEEILYVLYMNYFTCFYFLSLFAASGGASNILACETSNAMFALSQEVIIEAKYQTQIRTVNKMSNDLVNGDDFDKRFVLRFFFAK